MAEVKKYSKNWLKVIVSDARRDVRNPEEVLVDLLDNLEEYLRNKDREDANRGKGMSEAKYAAILINSKKGGWKKGRPRKPKEVE